MEFKIKDILYTAFVLCFWMMHGPVLSQADTGTAEPYHPLFRMTRNPYTLLDREIRKIIRLESGIDFSIVPAMVVGVMHKNAVYVFSYGDGDSTRDIFELGSLTKPFTAFLAYAALDSLGLTEHTPVCNFIPDSLCVGEWKNLTILQILEHRTGLARAPLPFGDSEVSSEDPYLDYDLDHLIQDVKRMQPEPGKYSYSHISYALLHWLFESVGGLESFSETVLARLFTEGDLAWSVPDSVITTGHGFDGRPVNPWHTRALSPAMGLKSTWKGLLGLTMRPNLPGIDTFLGLSPEVKKELNAHSRSKTYKVHLGWFLIQSGRSTVYYHTGRTGGHQCSAAFIPGEKTGVVVLSNGAAGSGELCLSILRMLKRSREKRFTSGTFILQQK